MVISSSIIAISRFLLNSEILFRHMLIVIDTEVGHLQTWTQKNGEM